MKRASGLRLAAWVILFSLAWTALFGIAMYGPFVALRLEKWVRGMLTLTWVVQTAGGVWSAFSSKSGDKGSRNWIDILAVVAAPVFVAGLFVILSVGIYRLGAAPLAVHSACSSQLEVTVQAKTPCGSATINASAPTKHVEPMSLADYVASVQSGRMWKQGWWLAPIALGFFLVALLLSLRVNINEFAMNTLYRNRLVRCYLGASRPPEEGTDRCRRSPNSFTGFDPHDDLFLNSARTGAGADNCLKPYAGPYSIINAALNLTHGRRLAWQERKAESFTFTPRYCGGTISDTDAYLPTTEYVYPQDGVYLGTAIAISGAAVSPLVGFHYSAAGFLLTLFNARLGQWLGNPSSASHSNRFGPRVGFFWLIKELLGLMDDRAPYVYLSDGGNFENLGIYELVRRKVKYIIAGDADADPDLTFGDLANAIRKCRSDFGAEIAINIDAIRRDATTNMSKAHYALGDIAYADGSTGVLIYIKASLTSKDPTDVLEYHAEHQEFPHQTTADQWFNESQFESYRQLGLCAASSAWDELKGRYQLRGIVERIAS